MSTFLRSLLIRKGIVNDFIKRKNLLFDLISNYLALVSCKTWLDCPPPSSNLPGLVCLQSEQKPVREVKRDAYYNDTSNRLAIYDPDTGTTKIEDSLETHR